jgi:serine/threonine-protein kinase HipA
VNVGVIDRDRDGGTWFRPSPDWLAGGQRPALGLGFLRDPSPRRARIGLPFWFENLLPASESALRARICAEHGLRDTDGAGLLRVLGRDLPGAVEVRGDLEDEEEPESHSTLPLRISFSLAGMQLKFSMAERAGRFALPARDQQGAWIVKLPGDRFPGLPQVEATTMAWARACGQDVPECRVIDTDQVDGLEPGLRAAHPEAFLIRRFDRGDGFRRFHQEDFAQALEIHPAHLYGDTGPHRVSYDGLTKLVLDAAGPEAQALFLRRLAFVVVSGNGDAHLKNYSFRWVDDAPRPALSPLYDQVSTISFPQFGWSGEGPRLALALGRERSLARLDLENLRVLGRRGEAPRATEIFVEAARFALAKWSEVEDRAPAAMRAAIAEHVQRVPLLRRLG